MNIRDLKYVVAVAQEEHFGRAAKKCHVSQPALSGQIQKLELFLGVKLFERTNRRVIVTDIGREIVTQAKELLRQADEIMALARAAEDPLAGPFKLGMITTIGPFLAPLILSAISEALPKVDLILVEGYTIDLERRLASGDLDAAILATEPEHSGLAKTDLYEEPFLAVSRKDHPLASNELVKIEDFNDCNLLLLSDGHCLRDQVLGFLKAHHDDSANTRETSLATLISLVAINNSVTLLPALAWSESNGNYNDVAVRDISPATVGRKVCLAHRSTCSRNLLRATLVEVICNCVPPDIVQISSDKTCRNMLT